MSIWKLDRDFDEYFKTYNKKKLELIIKESKEAIDSGDKHLEILKDSKVSIKDHLDKCNDNINIILANKIVLDKIIDSAENMIYNIDNSN